MATVKANLLKLLKKNSAGEYITDEVVEEPGVEVIRTEIQVSQETITESENNYKYTGLLYVATPV